MKKMDDVKTLKRERRRLLKNLNSMIDEIVEKTNNMKVLRRKRRKIRNKVGNINNDIMNADGEDREKLMEEKDILLGDIKYIEKRIMEIDNSIELMKLDALDTQKKIMRINSRIKQLENKV